MLGRAPPVCCVACRIPAATEAAQTSLDPSVASESDLHLVPSCDDDVAFKGGTATQLRSRCKWGLMRPKDDDGLAQLDSTLLSADASVATDDGGFGGADSL